MTVQAYPATTSAPQGGSLDFHLNDPTGLGTDATVVVTEFGTGREFLRTGVSVKGHPPTDPDLSRDRGWPVQFTLPLNVPTVWPSGLYRADFQPGVDREGTAYFAVRSAQPGVGARILVSIPFPTWHAYSYAGTAGASPYWNEQPDRGSRVSLNRPCTAGPDWETPILKWLSTSGFAVDYCSAYDLHLSSGKDLLNAYQLLMCIGHDEYWTAEMRDTAEAFLSKGGNIAFLTGNTCWWQIRLDDGGRTFVCYRDATEDPLAGEDDRHVTVEWSSAPVNRPENALTGVSFRHGAGCWIDPNQMQSAAWTVRFADHWIFEGTGLRDGDLFGQGTVGYETDAAEIVEENGVPRMTGRDGTPPSFVVLATADLNAWRNFGRGGSATMGVFRAPGGGTVFNAATTGWGKGFADLAVDRITRNVLTRLSVRWPGDAWERIGNANEVTAMVACENSLFATDTGNSLWARDPVGQNILWTQIGHANNVRAMASPREATGGRPIALYAVTADDQLWQREAVHNEIGWKAIGTAPGIVALAASYEFLFGATTTNDLVYLPINQIGANTNWTRAGHANNVVAMTNLNGKLFCVTRDLTLSMRPPLLYEVNWTAIGTVPAEATALAGYAGKLFLSTKTNGLFWRDAVK
jgi:hypothetical protein